MITDARVTCRDDVKRLLGSVHLIRMTRGLDRNSTLLPTRRPTNRQPARSNKMYRLTRLPLPLYRPPVVSRALSTSLAHLKTPSSQGHATRKSSDPTHKDKDVQSASVTAAKQSKSASQAGSDSGSDQPFDAARQGGSGGESKSGSEGSGPGQGWEGSMKDQVGGQSGGGSKKGGKEGAAGDSITETIANKVVSPPPPLSRDSRGW